MNTAATYQLSSSLGIVSHYNTPVALVRDAVDKEWWQQERQLQVAMQVRSGDYFATLATKLDELSQAVKEKDEMAADDLELIVNDLLYLQRNYQISKKS
jgi:hypothetical protein